MIDGRNVFDKPINSMNKTHENIRRIATGKRDDYTTGFLLDYPYFKENYKMIAIDLSKQNELDADPRAIQQTNFTANLELEIQQYSLLLKKQKKCFRIFIGHRKSFVNINPLRLFLII